MALFEGQCSIQSGELIGVLDLSVDESVGVAAGMVNPYSRRGDVIVISDEAHRTQYGTLALNMRGAPFKRVVKRGLFWHRRLRYWAGSTPMFA
jgi:hypothetical protein